MKFTAAILALAVGIAVAAPAGSKDGSNPPSPFEGSEMRKKDIEDLCLKKGLTAGDKEFNHCRQAAEKCFGTMQPRDNSKIPDHLGFAGLKKDCYKEVLRQIQSDDRPGFANGICEEGKKNHIFTEEALLEKEDSDTDVCVVVQKRLDEIPKDHKPAPKDGKFHDPEKQSQRFIEDFCRKAKAILTEEIKRDCSKLRTVLDAAMTDKYI